MARAEDLGLAGCSEITPMMCSGKRLQNLHSCWHRKYVPVAQEDAGRDFASYAWD